MDMAVMARPSDGGPPLATMQAFIYLYILVILLYFYIFNMEERGN
jgi:hypothetical protein